MANGQRRSGSSVSAKRRQRRRERLVQDFEVARIAEKRARA